MLTSGRRSERWFKEFENKTQIFTSCLQCKSIVNIYQYYKDEILAKIEDQEFQQVPHSKMHNVVLVSNQKQWKIKCENCSQTIGKLYKSSILISKKLTYKTTIKYESVKQNKEKHRAKQEKRQHRLLQLAKLNQRIRKYLSHSLKLIQSGLSKIQGNKIDPVEKELNNFKKFYQKMTKKSFNHSSNAKQLRY